MKGIKISDIKALFTIIIYGKIKFEPYLFILNIFFFV